MRNNYERMRLMRGGREIGYERGGDPYDRGYDRMNNSYGESRRGGMYSRRSRYEHHDVEPGRDDPGYDYRDSNHYGGGHGGNMIRMESQDMGGMSYEDAEEWVEMMARPDGGRGPKWKFEDAERIMREKKIKCDPVEFWVAMNAMYSDYYKVAKHYGVANDEFFAKMAEAFIRDDDAVTDKVATYWECIVRH